MSSTQRYPSFLLPVLQAHGAHSLAYSIRQPGMLYFGDATRGVIAYRRRLGQSIVLGDPVCAPENKERLIHDFIIKNPKSLFMQINRHTLDILQKKGFYYSPVGVENDIDTATFNLSGKRKADIRHYRNKAQAAGITVQEMDDTTETRAALKPVSDAWLPSKSWFAHELEFLARPFQLEPEPGTRIFASKIQDEIVAFVILDPMSQQGKATGYVVTILRHIPDAPEGAMDYVLLHIIKRLREEQVPTLSLGISPFHRLRTLAQEERVNAWLVYAMFHALNQWGNPIYHFRGLSFHKSRYRAKETPIFTAVHNPIALLPLYASARACRML